MFSLILVPAIAVIELKFFSFLIRVFRLDIRFNKPVEIIALVIVEIIAVISSLKLIFSFFSIYSSLIIIFWFIRLYGLLNLKKWVVYIYLSFLLFSFTNDGFFNIKNISLNIITFMGQLFILLIYWLYVYKPNKKLFK